MVKSKLLASTIIVAAAAAVAAAPASAAKLKLGGYYEAWVGMGADGNKSHVNEFDVKHDSEINFDWKQKLKNGLTVGGRLELEAGTGTATGNNTWDETSMYVKGSFGKLVLGNNDAAAAYVGSVSGVGPVGIVKSDAGDWIGMTGAQTIDNDNDVGMGDNQNITYFTPKMGALSAAVSYMPDASGGVATDYDDSEITGDRDGISAMVKYAGKAGGAKYSLAMGYSQVDTGSVTEDGWNMGVKVSSGAYTISAFSAEEDTGSGVKNTDAGAAIKYQMSKSTAASLQYGAATNEAVNGDDDTTTILTAGYQKKLGGGVSFEGSIFNADIDNDSDSSENISEMGIVGGFKVKF